jgi:hypothetical protein
MRSDEEIKNQFSDKSLTNSQISLSPRFYIGYSQADIDDSLVKLNIFIKTDKEVYKP